MKLKVSWAAQIIAAVILLQTLYYKFGAHPDSIHIFSELGMEPYGRWLVGIGELIAAIMLLWRPFIWLGAFMTMIMMISAIFFHVTILGIVVRGDGGVLFTLACITLSMATLVLYLRWKEVPRLPFSRLGGN